ncbi:hypothetical protein GIB67_013096 [Kingdonia uniflora]|uniref:Uncharacterized protein n=1 Tax=Kingdonia uniflora TaxID=39325 RepID=A0A7J7LXE9_9MAGN|nr:hypothetical protein GIB67_013096 [Kingdonia uniflora]
MPLSNFTKGILNCIKACPAKLNGNVYEVISVCKGLSPKWIKEGVERILFVEDIIKYYKVKYFSATRGANFSTMYPRPQFFDLDSASKLWDDNLILVKDECTKIADEDDLNLSYRHKRVNIKLLKVQKAQVKMTDIGKGGSSYAALPPVLHTSVDSSIYVSKVAKAQALALQPRSSVRSSVISGRRRIGKKNPKNTLSDSIIRDGEETESALKKKRLADIPHVPAEVLYILKGMVLGIGDALSLAQETVSGLDMYGPPEQTQAREANNQNKDTIELRMVIDNLRKVLARKKNLSTAAAHVTARIECLVREYKALSDAHWKILCEARLGWARVKIEWDEVDRKSGSRYTKIQPFLPGGIRESTLDVTKDLMMLTLFLEAEIDSERGLKEAHLRVLEENDLHPEPTTNECLTTKVRNMHSLKAKDV